MKTRSRSAKKRLRKVNVYSDSNDSQEHGLGYISESKTHKANSKRLRKNEDQINVLIKEFNKNPFWSKKLVAELSSLTDLSESQVYKWNWDYRKKIRRVEKNPSDSMLYCKETLRPSRLDEDLLKMQSDYKKDYNTLPFTTPSRFLYSAF